MFQHSGHIPIFYFFLECQTKLWCDVLTVKMKIEFCNCNMSNQVRRRFTVKTWRVAMIHPYRVKLGSTRKNMPTYEPAVPRIEYNTIEWNSSLTFFQYLIYQHMKSSTGIPIPTTVQYYLHYIFLSSLYLSGNTP